MKQYDQVREFHLAFNHPVKDKPTSIKPDRAIARARWMKEEINEFLLAGTVVDQADALVDALYFVIGTLVEMGIRPEPLFDIVQAANMAKLFPDGKPHYRKDGKVQKPENWQPPEPLLKKEIERQKMTYIKEQILSIGKITVDDLKDCENNDLSEFKDLIKK